MGANDGEIFSQLRKVGEVVVRIDERTERIDRDMREHHADHEARLRALERENDKRTGVVAGIVVVVSVAFQGVIWAIKHFFGDAGT